MGSGGVGIVRISGPAAMDVLARLCAPPAGGWQDRRVHHAEARDADGRLDEVIVLIMRAPRSYTGEDVVELHGHGGALNMARLLRACLAAGARAASPGEFTRRAFANGRLDLTQAEAVAAVIGAASERALKSAQGQLGGTLGARIEKLRGEAALLLAEVEASIDFPEEGLDFTGGADLLSRAGQLRAALSSLARTFVVGRALREGLTVALVGAPNVGKSSLLNALAGEERALVAAEPGTTRDFLEARVVWDGVPVTLIDTAGERVADSAIERRGVELGRARAARADVIVRVLDASAPGEAGEGLVVWNKIDRAAAPADALGVSALTGAGLEQLRAAVLRSALGEAIEGGEGELIASERQRALIVAAEEGLARAEDAWRARRPAELVAADLRICAGALAEVHGAHVGDEVLDALFARFCVGK